MAKARKSSRSEKTWTVEHHKTMLGVWFLVLGVVLYLVETSVIPWGGSVWSMGLILTGVMLAFKRWLMPFG